MLDELAPDDVREAALLVSFFDLAGFARHARGRDASEVFDVCAGYFDLTGGIIEDGGGRLIKAIGDAGLAAFEDADAGVRTLLEVREAGGEWFRSRGWPSQVVVKAHFGPVVAGYVGSPGDKRLDIYGATVNTAAMIAAFDHGFALTPQAFRKVRPETRALFKKHTPPIIYIPVAQRH